jgi:ATP-dependent protease ClpP protease subunit
MLAEIYLNSDEADLEDNGINFKVATKFMKKLHDAEETADNKIIVHTSTIGGEWADGMSIFDNILYSSLPVYMIGHGCLCSMGTIILQAAHKRYLMPDCDIMVHFGDLTLSGHQVSVESGTKYYVKVKNQMIDIYTDKCMKGKHH